MSANGLLLPCATIPSPKGCSSDSSSFISHSKSGTHRIENLFPLVVFLFRFSCIFLMFCRFRTAQVGEDLLFILLSIQGHLSVQGFWRIFLYYLFSLFDNLLLIWNLFLDGASQTQSFPCPVITFSEFLIFLFFLISCAAF